ncbi:MULTISPECIES: RNA polymerase sigma factor [Paraliobacillus]|uniref:RNA polymerase sigma factor n=1 Tax=Paraliobacillus TaxID=200903 RepID=UPI000DD395EB|nr:MULTISPECIES: RNA polymerase sigma factor [Paraliobacillus]
MQWNEDEIRIIYRTYYKDVYRFILSFTKSQEDAEDLTQEVFVRLFNTSSKYKGDSSMKTWLFTIAKNISMDHFRKQSRQVILQDFLLNIIPFKEKSTEEKVESKDELGQVYDKLSELKTDYRMVIVLRNMHDFSVKETANVMNWSESKVKVTYHRAIKQLRTLLEDYEQGIKSGGGLFGSE